MERLVIFLALKLVLGKDLKVDLPLCPTNIQFLPQSLPMHCRMPRNAKFPFPSFPPGSGSTVAPFIPSFYQNANKAPFPFPIPAGYPGYPGIQMPGPYPLPMPPAPMPGPLPAPIPLPMSPIPISLNGPSQKLPVIVMPFYSPDKTYKKKERQPIRSSNSDTDDDKSCVEPSETETSSETDVSSDRDSDSGWWKSKRGFRRNGRRNHKHRGHRLRRKRPREMVTPVLQYVNKNGYVIFEKKITKEEAKEWLSNDKNYNNEHKEEFEDDEDKYVNENRVRDENKEKIRNKVQEKAHQHRPHTAAPLDTVQPHDKKHHTQKVSNQKDPIEDKVELLN